MPELPEVKTIADELNVGKKNSKSHWRGQKGWDD